MFAPGAGRPLGVGLALIVVLAALVGSGIAPRTVGAVLLLVAATLVWLFFAAFLRDPDRQPGADVVAPADGRIRRVTAEGRNWVISTFMGVSDVHVNRFPLDGKVTRIVNAGAGFRPAYDELSKHNVRRHYTLATSGGDVEVIQMTGAFARRLVSLVHEGDARHKGEHLGMIILGSRVDVLLPAERFEPMVVPGARVRAGESTIARVRP